MDLLTIPTPDPDPADFVGEITNRYLPLVRGTRWRYDGTLSGRPVTVTAEALTTQRRILGVDTTEMRWRTRRHGRVLDEQLRWYAQDDRGNVWLFGAEGTDPGLPDWIAGRNGARAGLAMAAAPRVGDGYLMGSPEGAGAAVIRAVDARLDLDVDSFTGLVEIEESLGAGTPRDWLVYYADGIGPVYRRRPTAPGDELSLQFHRSG